MGSGKSAVARTLALLGLLLASSACASGSPEDASTTEGHRRAEPPTLELGAPVTASEPVGPPPDSPVADIRRDCGMSAPLTNGETLWVYCDTVLFSGDGRLEFFVNTSAATAERDEPLVLDDALDPRGEPYPFLDPVPGYPPCTGGQGTFTWPTAVVAVPTDRGSERLVVYFENVCVVPGELKGYDLGVAELAYPTEHPPGGEEAIRATVLEPRLFERTADDIPYGLAAVYADGFVYVYQCPAAAQACRVARARPTDVADLTAYEYWNGDGWTSDAEAAQPMSMPESFEGTKPAVEWVEELGLFVMANHRVEKTGTIVLRGARSPQGPWGPPLEVEVPGCAGFYPDICFAAEVHDHLSTSDGVGLTWFDPGFATGVESPTRFAHVEVSVGP